MWIRKIRLQGDPKRLEEGVAVFKDKAVPAMSQMSGYLGSILIANRETGEAEAIVYWQDEAALRASEGAAEQLRTAISSEAGTRVVDVDRFEMALVERTGPPQAGTFLRTNDVKGDPAKIDEAVAFIKSKVAPALRGQSGFRSLVTAINRQTGRAITASGWNTQQDLKNSEAAVVDLREQAVKASGATSVKVEVWENVFAQLTAGALTGS